MKTLAVAAALAVLSTTAFAADLSMPYKAPPPMAAPSFSWTGFYLGTHTGMATGWTTTNNVSPFGGFDAGIPLSYNLNPATIFGGAEVGYNWQTSIWVLGLEAEGGYLGLRENQRPAPDDLVQVKYGWYGTFTGRIGIATDRFLTYVKGGAAVAQIRNTASDLDGPGVIDPTDFSTTSGARWGWTVGTGFEYAMLPAVSLKAEYDYMDFGRRTSTNLDGDLFHHKNNAQVFKVGVNYHLGGGTLY